MTFEMEGNSNQNGTQVGSVGNNSTVTSEHTDNSQYNVTVYYNSPTKTVSDAGDLRIWLERKEHSVEGHTAECILTFNNRIIWGPQSCHDNTFRLKDALFAVDPRFQITLRNKRKSMEGHTYSLSLMADGHLYLDRLSTHENMIGLCQAINDCLLAENNAT
ncbi:unnamed protein product [Clonostachys rhizophaga]|uniref:Uncharacterized protein n=1 Tax=Clonostachys rhizophaga TaxID=160324 RepID=A0A9N9VCB5_9HYPO|nr:unnamed protein product [Clonostachys rhizophaga]